MVDFFCVPLAARGTENKQKQRKTYIYIYTCMHIHTHVYLYTSICMNIMCMCTSGNTCFLVCFLVFCAFLRTWLPAAPTTRAAERSCVALSGSQFGGAVLLVLGFGFRV